MRNRSLTPLATLVIVTATALSACDRGDSRSAGQDVGDATRNAADTVAAKARDVSITTAVKSRLALDADLSALSINVDTTDGRVALRGSAPSAAALAKAAQLAGNVEGVKSVSNELSVQSR